MRLVWRTLTPMRVCRLIQAHMLCQQAVEDLNRKGTAPWLRLGLRYANRPISPFGTTGGGSDSLSDAPASTEPRRDGPDAWDRDRILALREKGGSFSPVGSFIPAAWQKDRKGWLAHRCLLATQPTERRQSVRDTGRVHCLASSSMSGIQWRCQTATEPAKEIPP